MMTSPGWPLTGRRVRPSYRCASRLLLSLGVMGCRVGGSGSGPAASAHRGRSFPVRLADFADEDGTRTSCRYACRVLLSTGSAGVADEDGLRPSCRCASRALLPVRYLLSDRVCVYTAYATTSQKWLGCHALLVTPAGSQPRSLVTLGDDAYGSSAHLRNLVSVGNEGLTAGTSPL
jgi:hypothetical protein